MKKNEITILFSKKNKLWVQNCVKNTNNPVPVRLISLLSEIGMILSSEFIGLISQEDEERILDTLSPYISETRGIGKEWRSVWKTAEDVPDTEEEQLLIQVGLYMNPDLFEKIRESQGNDVSETNQYLTKVVLEPGYDDDLRELSKSMLSSPLPLSSEDRDILVWMSDDRKDLIVIPEKIPVKENLAIVLSLGYGEERISSVTDILRMAILMSNGGKGAILGDSNKYIALKRKERRHFLSMLERYLEKKEMKWCLQDAKKYQNAWKILSSVTHPKEKDYPSVFEFFGKIQRGHEDMVRGWNSKIQMSYDRKDYDEVIRLLSQRPSEFIRKYDSLLRKAWTDGDTERFEKIQEKLMNLSGASSKVLFELYKYYDRRNEEIERSYLSKSGIRKFYSPLEPLPQELIKVAQSSILMAIRNSWKEKDTFKGTKVYLDLPDDIDFILSLRSILGDSTTSDIIPGQKIKFPTKGKIKFFSQWIDPSGKEDLDLHAYLGNCGKRISLVSWNTRFSDETRFITHSGDVRYQKGDCSEFVTVDYDKDFDYTWMIITVQNFECRGLNSLDNWIGISDLEKGVVFRGKVNTEEINMVAFLVNLKEGWASLLLEGLTRDVLTEFPIEQYITESTLNVKELITWYIQDTGGEVTEEKEESDMILSTDDYTSGKIHGYLL